MTAIYAYFVAFFELQILSSISLSEIVSFMLITFSLVKFQWKLINTDVIYLFAFIVWVIATFVIVHKNDYFLTSSYLNNLLRLLIYTVGFITVPYYLSDKKRLKTFFSSVTTAAYIVCVVGIIEFVLILIGGNPDFRVTALFSVPPSERLSLTRVYSILSEPAHFSIFLGTVMILLMKYNSTLAEPKKYKLLIILVIINLVISLSLIGTVILSYLVYIVLFGVTKRGGKLKKALMLFISFVFLIIVVFQVEFLRKEIVDRIPLVFSQEDTSSNQRILGSFEYAFFALDRSPAAGVGLGQLVPFFQDTNIFLEYYYFNDERGGGVNNIFSSILLQAGIVGFLIFMLFVNSLFKKDKHLYFMFLILCFSWGYFNTPLFWLYFYLARVLTLNKVNIDQISIRPKTVTQ